MLLYCGFKFGLIELEEVNSQNNCGKNVDISSCGIYLNIKIRAIMNEKIPSASAIPAPIIAR